MPKYLTEHKVRKLAQKVIGDKPLVTFTREHPGINANSLANYLSGYLPRCPPGLQEALGLERVAMYREIEHPGD